MEPDVADDQPVPEALAAVDTDAPEKPEGWRESMVTARDDGKAFVLVGLPPDRIERATSPDAVVRLALVGHAAGTTRIEVSGAEPGSTVAVWYRTAD